MASHRSGHRPGGGIASTQHVKTSVKTGAGSFNARPAGVAQLGYSVGDHATHSGKSTGYRGEKLHGPDGRNFQKVPFGNEKALDVKGGGPGPGREIYKTGTQTTHGPVAGSAPARSRDILSQFGPESKRS
jgi:hypothetical protein